jgi:uncharacterized repeat protein (TIGR03803 family)
VAARTFNANAQTETNLYSFVGSPTDGANPHAGLVQGTDGYFYGTTSGGGTYGDGTVFRINPDGTYTNLYSFAGSPNDGSGPTRLVQGTDSSFYGTTSGGGMYSNGIVFRISPNGTYTNLYSFADSPNDGNQPWAGLVQGSDGNFYGTTSGGGTYGDGTVFRISPSGTYTNLYSFVGSPTDGSLPAAGLVQGSDGNFYGTTVLGGAGTQYAPDGGGTVFRISPSGTETILYSFGSSLSDAFYPYAGLLQGSDDNFYGTASDGGTYANGAVFRISPSGTYTNLYSFGSSLSYGWDPQAGLLQGSDGNFYGTTYFGGNTYLNSGDGVGTVFRISTSGIYTTLYSFGSQTNDGARPAAGLVQGSDGNFYGTTLDGGAGSCGLFGCGTVFMLDVGLGPISSNCTFSISPTNAVFDAAGGSDSVSVIASNGCAWTAVSNDPSFITITSGNSGTGDGTIRYSVAANMSTNGLTGTMTIAGQTFTVTQSGASAENCTYTLNATSVTLAARGGSKNASVKVKGSDCSWTAVSNDSFITITSGSSGTGNGKVDYAVPGNTNTTALSGTMTIAGQTFTVNQAAGGCTFKLSPKAGKIKAAGGSATVKVKPNFNDCAWTAVSNDSFIMITSGASGTGKGTVSYAVAANTNTTVLTGSITIDGETFTVTQSGEK